MHASRSASTGRGACSWPTSSTTRATSSIPSGISEFDTDPETGLATRRRWLAELVRDGRGVRRLAHRGVGDDRAGRGRLPLAGRPADARPRGRPGRGRPRAHRLDASRRRRRRPDRRGRGVRARRSRVARVPGHDRPERRDVRPAWEALRVPLLRDPLVRERRLPASRASAPRCSCDRSSRRTGSRPCARAAGASRSRPARGTSARRSPRHPALNGEPAVLHPPDRIRRVEASVRIGITKGVERPWRFFDPDSSAVSRPISSAPRGRPRRTHA